MIIVLLHYYTAYLTVNYSISHLQPDRLLEQLRLKSAGSSGTQSYDHVYAEDPPPRALTSWLAGAVHRNLDGTLVGGHLGWIGEDGDGECEALP